MKLRELLGDPSWLFDLGFPIQPIVEPRSVTKPELLEWALEDQYRVPPLSSLSGEPRFADVSLAWSDAGLFIHATVQTKSAKVSNALNQALFFTFYLDTRWSPGVHRATTYCHRFEFFLNRPASTQLVRGHGELANIQRARDFPAAIHPKNIAVGTLKREFGYEIKAFLNADALTGFEPREFQELGIFYVINDVLLGSQCMARTRQSPFFEDPSLWCRGKLIQPIA
ncbi:MAG: hypothetical protein ACOVLE_09340 [Pirellula staleyi]